MTPAEFRSNIPMQVAGIKQKDGTYIGKLSIGGHVIIRSSGHESAEKAANSVLTKLTKFIREYFRETDEIKETTP